MESPLLFSAAASPAARPGCSLSAIGAAGAGSLETSAPPFASSSCQAKIVAAGSTAGIHRSLPGHRPPCCSALCVRSGGGSPHGSTALRTPWASSGSAGRARGCLESRLAGAC